jgi:hypothetical protein
MKINFIYFLIALAISGLIAFGFYSFYEGDNKILLVTSSLIFLSLTLMLSLAVTIKDRTRVTVLVRTVSGIMFFVGLITNLIFSFFEFNKDWYIIIIGLILIIYSLVVYSLLKSKQ